MMMQMMIHWKFMPICKQQLFWEWHQNKNDWIIEVVDMNIDAVMTEVKCLPLLSAGL